MSRWRRHAPGGIVYHVLNRAAKRSQIFFGPDDYGLFIALLFDAARRLGMRVLAYCVMPNHWHLVLWPAEDDSLAGFLHRLTVTHARTFRSLTGTVGEGHVYQGPYRRFPVETESYYYNVMRYVEANALRAGMVERAQDWKWSSASERAAGELSVVAGPLPLADDWLTLLNVPLPEDHLHAIRVCAHDGRPYGSEVWVGAISGRCALEHTLRSHGRPRRCIVGGTVLAV